MVIPMISVHFVDGLGWTAGAVGLVLAARQLFQQGLTPLSGVLADRLGAKPLIAIGMIVRAVGFAAMGFAETYELLMISAIVAALGGALFESPRSAAVVALTDESERSTYFAKTGVVAGLGITAGTQLGALLLGVDFRLVSLVAAASYVLILVMILIWLPAVRVADKGGPLPRFAPGLPRSHLSLVHRLHGRALVHVGPVLDYVAAGGGRHFRQRQRRGLGLRGQLRRRGRSRLPDASPRRTTVWGAPGAHRGCGVDGGGIDLHRFLAGHYQFARRGLCLLPGDRAGSTDRAGGGLGAR